MLLDELEADVLDSLKKLRKSGKKKIVNIGDRYKVTAYLLGNRQNIRIDVQIYNDPGISPAPGVATSKDYKKELKKGNLTELEDSDDILRRLKVESSYPDEVVE